jgi:hypothetical protein
MLATIPKTHWQEEGRRDRYRQREAGSEGGHHYRRHSNKTFKGHVIEIGDTAILRSTGQRSRV